MTIVLKSDIEILIGEVEVQMMIFEAKEVTDELAEAFQCLMPQLSDSSQSPGFKELKEIISSQSVKLLIAKNQGQIVGFLSLVIFRIPTGKRARIEDVVVDRSFRRQGIGKALMYKALELAESQGAKTIDLTSRPSREGTIDFYKKLNFMQRKTNVYRCEICRIDHKMK